MIPALLSLAILLARVGVFSYQRAQTIATGLCIKAEASASIAATNGRSKSWDGSRELRKATIVQPQDEILPTR